MKKAFVSIIAVLLAATALFAQTPQEIVAKMDQETARFDTEGFSMVMDMKIPLMGTFSTKMFSLGKKYKAELDVKGETAITWSDGVTDWDFDASKNEITITKATSSDAEESLIKLKKETPEAWHLLCTKIIDKR